MKEIKVLINEEQINKRLDELANQLMEEYKGKNLIFLCILKGSVFFTVELAKRIKNNIQFFKENINSFIYQKFDDKVVLFLFDEILDLNSFMNLDGLIGSLSEGVQNALYSRFEENIYKAPQGKFIELVGRLYDGNYHKVYFDSPITLCDGTIIDSISIILNFLFHLNQFL